MFDYPLKQWPTKKKKRRRLKYKSLNISRSFLDEKKAFFVIIKGLSFGGKTKNSGHKLLFV